MRYLQLVADFEAREPIAFPDNPVNTLRGAVGFRLKDLVCLHRNRTRSSCRGCLAEQACYFATCWESAFPLGDQPGLASRRDIPHPLVFDARFPGPSGFGPGRGFSFGVTLLGPAVDGLPFLLLALEEAGARGFSRTKGKARLVSVKVDGSGNPLSYGAGKKSLEKIEPLELCLDDPNLVPEGPQTSVGIEFLSPTSFKSKETGGVVNLPEFHRVIRSILKRCSSFQAADRRPTPKWDFGAIFSRAEKVRLVRSELFTSHWERFSARQRQRVFWGGVVGTAWFEGDITPFLPVLRAGEIVRVGRGTTFGQGRIRIRSSGFQASSEVVPPTSGNDKIPPSGGKA